MKCPYCDGLGKTAQDPGSTVLVRPIPTGTQARADLLRDIDDKLPYKTVLPDSMILEVIYALRELGYVRAMPDE